MFGYDAFRNWVNVLVGRNQEYEELLRNGDITTAISKMMTNQNLANEVYNKEYLVDGHDVMHRHNKEIKDKNGNTTGFKKAWKLPIPYQVYINEISLVFLYGRPVKWTKSNEGGDNAFAMFNDVLKRTRFDSKIRQCKRLAGAETESAMLFRVFKNDDGNPDVQIRVLAKSKGDEIYTRWDNFENLLSFAWGYYAKEGDATVHHIDVYTPNTIYHCTARTLGWEVVEEINFVGKIPVIYFHQNKEWDGVDELINREEDIASRRADTNDYFSDPIAIINADVVKNMPQKGEPGKLLIAKDAEGVDKVAKYLTWDAAPESKKQEIEWLQEQILTKTFTPKISLDSMEKISQLSAKALKTVMLLADIKASKHKEVHDELLDRIASLIVSIIANVLDIKLKGECDEMIIHHEFQEPFGEDVKEDLDNIIKAVDGGILSTEGGVELNPLIKDVKREQDRINGENEDRMKKQNDIFAQAEEGEGIGTGE